MLRQTQRFQKKLFQQMLRLYRRRFPGKIHQPKSQPSSAQALLKFAGVWRGDDLEDCLCEVVNFRGEAKF